jgi:hypothetical protein
VNNKRSLWRVLLFQALLVIAPGLAWADSRPPEKWLVDYIDKVLPILMKEPFLELLGQTDTTVPYTYQEAVKLTGHSCGAVAGAWTITRKALEALYPGTSPVRGQIRVIMPGSEDEWYVGVFGEVISYITGAAPQTGFPGAEFGRAYKRRNLMIYKEQPSKTPPVKTPWIFERMDNGTKVGVRYDLNKIKPPITPERAEMGTKVADGLASREETAEWRVYWNDRARFVLENADTLPGFFVVEKLSY